MKCPRCGVDNRGGVAFCEDCGARLELRCPSCGASIVAGKKFCGTCGSALDGAGSERLQAPGSYTPRHLAAKILTARETLEGERKQVTVLFADLKGSMELLVADRDPEEARKLLDPVITHMMDAVHRYEGTVNQVMGDGIMALFGAPLAHEDHAVRACFAALSMQQRISRYGDELQRTQGVPIQIRVGLNSGEVVVRSIGSDLRMDYTAVGQTTHLAARMEQIAKPGSVLLTGDTLRLAEGYVQVRALGPVAVKGIERPIEAFELTAAASVRSRLQAAIARGLSRFVGRATELANIRRIGTRAEQGQGQVVAVVGEPGVGKSRLFYEFFRAPQARPHLVLEASSVSYGKATSYLPVIALLRSYFKIDERADTRTRVERVTGKLLALDRSLEDAIAPILALLEALPEDSPLHALDPSQRRRRTLEALRRLFLRESQVQSLVLVFEDLHWIDKETQTLLDGLVDALPAARILLLVNYRPEYQHGWGSKTYYTQLRIDPLAAEDTRELLDALLGGDAALDTLKRFLAARGEGNPLFLEESIRNLLETGALDGTPGAYRLTRPVGDLHAPATVQAILGARIDRLAPEHKRVLQGAAVIGKDVPLVILQGIADVSDETLQQMLADLQSCEFLYQASLFPDVEYTFKHALTHEVAYAGLLHDRRRALHGRIVEVVERLYPDRLGDHVDLLAHHALRGEAWPRVVRYARAAGVKAAGRAAYREAVVLFDEALGALGRLPQTRDTEEAAIDLRLDLRNALFPLGDLARVADVLGEARALAEALGDTRRVGRACSYTAQHCWLTGDLPNAIAHGQRAIAIATEVGDTPMRAATNLYVGEAYHALGAYREGLATLRNAVGSLEDDSIRERFGQSSLLVHARSSLVWCLAELGEFAEGFHRAEEVLRVARMVGRPFDLVTAHFALGQLLLHKGEVERAIEIFEPSVQLVREHNFRTWFAAHLASLGFLYARGSRLSDGIALLEEGVSVRPSYFRPALLYLGHAYLWAGRRDEAIALARRVIERAAKREERGHEAWALRLLGDATRADPSPVDSERAYRAAVSIAEERGMRPLLVHCHAGLGELYRRTENANAERHAREAAALAEALGMRLAVRAPGSV